MNRLEDFLLPPNLIERKEGFDQEIDAIIDDGGISGQPLSIEEISELELKNHPNLEVDDDVAGFSISYPLGYLDRLNKVDHQETIKWPMNEEKLSKEEIEEERLLSELGFRDWVQGIEDEEHYVDHEEEYHFDPVWFKENRMKGEGENANVTFEYDFSLNTEVGDEEYHLKSEPDTFPDYLLNDPEIVGYPDRVTQHQIYDWVKAKLPYNYFSIKDLGCGRGDFGNWLDVSFEHPSDNDPDQSPEINYIGIDNNPNLIQVGQKKYPELKLINSDFNDVSIQTDFTVCIGTLNDEHDLDKWMMFNKTLNHALNNTKTAILFVLQANCYGIEGHLDYPLHELVQNLSEGIRFEIDYSKLEDIYLLTVHIGGYNN